MGAIQSIEARDFCCFEEMSLVLADRGLVWLGGINHDSDSAGSNGSGKSSVFKALGWCLFDETIDKDPRGADGVIRNGAKLAHVSTRLEGGWTVVRERRPGKPTLKLVGEDGPFKGSKSEVQEMIVALVGMDWPTFRNTVLYGQDDRSRFLHSSDRERKEVLHAILRTSVFGEAFEIAKARTLEAKKRGDTLRADLERIRAQIGEHDVEAIQDRFDVFERERNSTIDEKRTAATAATARAHEIAHETPDVRSLKGSLEKRRKARERARLVAVEAEERGEAFDALVEAEQEARTAIRVERSKGEAVEANIAELEERERCPKCNARLDEGDAAKHLGELRATLAGIVVSLDGLRVKLTTTCEQKRAAEATYNEARGSADLVSDLDVEIAKLEGKIETASSTRELANEEKAKAKRLIAEIRTLSKRANPHAKSLADAKARIVELEATAKEKERDAKKADRRRAYLEFWSRGFGPSGLPSRWLDEAMPVLTERANHYLEALADGDITLSFSTQRELKSTAGEFRDQIEVSWEIEGVAGYTPSKGQARKMDVAIDFALMDLASGERDVGVMLLDECFEGLDVEGQTRVAALLQDLSKTRGSIFVISHRELPSIFVHEVIVEKRDGISSITSST